MLDTDSGRCGYLLHMNRKAEPAAGSADKSSNAKETEPSSEGKMVPHSDYVFLTTSRDAKAKP